MYFFSSHCHFLLLLEIDLLYVWTDYRGVNQIISARSRTVTRSLLNIFNASLTLRVQIQAASPPVMHFKAWRGQYSSRLASLGVIYSVCVPLRNQCLLTVQKNGYGLTSNTSIIRVETCWGLLSWMAVLQKCKHPSGFRCYWMIWCRMHCVNT